MFYKNIINSYIESISTGAGAEEIEESEYRSLLSMIQNCPAPPLGYAYRLRADTLEWELVELPPMPDPDPELTDEEALAIILGGGEA